MIQRLGAILGVSCALAIYGQEPDNTKANQRDRDPAQLTAYQQKLNKADREFTQKIRRAVVADKSLSIYAHNVKIITRDGVVTLKGPVRSEEEKRTIEKLARVVAGESNVTNLIEIAPGK